MRKQKIIVIIMLIISAVFLSGCNENNSNGFGKSDEEKIIGTWELKAQGSITFTGEGELYWFEGKKGTYWFEDGYINTSFIIDDEIYRPKFKYTFETYDTLILEYEPGAMVFNRVK